LAHVADGEDAVRVAHPNVPHAPDVLKGIVLVVK
jgi:hypothetical protein